ncbi:MAG: hypothetical protein D3922_14305, partial [Candidatus Electrothrix sp. AR1]|nr:hypothetical protein [Candidatus Electrothrix sp. AR1]
FRHEIQERGEDQQDEAAEDDVQWPRRHNAEGYPDCKADPFGPGLVREEQVLEIVGQTPAHGKEACYGKRNQEDGDGDGEAESSPLSVLPEDLVTDFKGFYGVFHGG